MNTRSEPSRTSGPESPDRRSNGHGRLAHLIQRTTNRLYGTDPRENRGGSFLREDLPSAYEQVQTAVEDLPEKIVQWLKQNEYLHALKAVERNLRRAVPASGRLFAKELYVLAARVRDAGERFDQRDTSERIARRVERAARRLHRAMQPSWRIRLNRTLRDHPVLCAGVALLAGYGLYRALRRIGGRARPDEKKEQNPG